MMGHTIAHPPPQAAYPPGGDRASPGPTPPARPSLGFVVVMVRGVSISATASGPGRRRHDECEGVLIMDSNVDVAWECSHAIEAMGRDADHICASTESRTGEKNSCCRPQARAVRSDIHTRRCIFLEQAETTHSTPHVIPLYCC